MTPIFVYGTLLPGERGWHWYLRHVADSWGPGRLGDHALYGRRRPYPFAVPEVGSWVVGALVWPNPRLSGHVLARLDAYEGLSQDPPLYVRDRAPVDTGDSIEEAWVWLAGPGFIADPDDLIPSGDWRRRDSTAGG